MIQRVDSQSLNFNILTRFCGKTFFKFNLPITA